MNYLNGGPWKFVNEFTEVESGKRNARPELQKALAACRSTRPSSSSPNSTACPAIWHSSPL
jgi:hypothetical protein